MSDDTSKRSPELEYERTTGISRRAFRLLLLLTFINTILLGASLMGPQTWHAVRAAFVDWKNQRAKSAAAAQTRKAQEAAREFRFPEGHVAYTEVPSEAMAYVTQGLPYYPIRPQNGEPPTGWQAPAIARVLPALRQAEGLSHDGQLFLHERTSPDGRRAFVLAIISPSFEFHNVNMARNNNTMGETTYRLSKRRLLQAVALVPQQDADLETIHHFELALVLPDTPLTEIGRELRSMDARGPSTQPVAIDRGNQLRLFGGSPNPTDPSHFTIPYELDGRAGVIDGWLGNDSLVLRPREGRSVPSADVPIWELLPAKIAPTTRPAPTR